MANMQAYTESDVPRPKIKESPTNFRLTARTHDTLEKAAKRLGIDKTAVIERLAEKLRQEPTLIDDIDLKNVTDVPPGDVPEKASEAGAKTSA